MYKSLAKENNQTQRRQTESQKAAKPQKHAKLKSRNALNTSKETKK
jgi:hypothetical protein